MELRKAWCRETAHESYQKKWNEDNPSYGQCAITCLAMQDLYGGDVYECKVKGRRHYVLITQEGYLRDFTRSQFGEERIIYQDLRPRTRASLLRCKSTKERYELLKARLQA